MTIELSRTRIMAALRSVKVAVGLIAYLAVTAALATLVPQGRDPAFYRQAYSPFVAGLVLGLRIDVFFRSAVFLVPAALFALNLFLCTLHRLTTAHAGGRRKPWGPDLVHLGLLLLLAGGAVTVFGRQEQMLYLPEGHAATLPDGSLLTVRSIDYQQYPDGRPKDYLTAVTVGPEGGPGRQAVIEVNRPLRVGGRRIYQTSYFHALALQKDRQGYLLAPGDGLPTAAGGALYFVRFDTLSAPGPTERSAASGGSIVFDEYGSDGSPAGVRQFAVGDTLEGGYTITRALVVTGLNVVRDPGFVPVAIALAMVALGLSLTFIEKGLVRGRPAPAQPGARGPGAEASR
jgi:hypothetical protein